MKITNTNDTLMLAKDSLDQIKGIISNLKQSIFQVINESPLYFFCDIKFESCDDYLTIECIKLTNIEHENNWIRGYISTDHYDEDHYPSGWVDIMGVNDQLELIMTMLQDVDEILTHDQVRTSNKPYLC